EPVPPRRLQPRVPRDLETICLKCLQKAPRKRYTSAADLADDLGRFLAGQPIRARPVGPAERPLLWARRNPTASALLLVGWVAARALVGLAVARGYSVRLEESNERLEEAVHSTTVARDEVERQRQRAESFLYLHRILLAHGEWRVNNVPAAQELLKACPVPLRHWEWHYLDRLCHAERLVLREHKNEVLALAYSPDRQRLASGSR